MFLIGIFEEVNGLDRSLVDRKMSSRNLYVINPFLRANLSWLFIGVPFKIDYSYIAGVATLFSSRAIFENKFRPRAALFYLLIISAEQKIFWGLISAIT